MPAVTLADPDTEFTAVRNFASVSGKPQGGIWAKIADPQGASRAVRLRDDARVARVDSHAEWLALNAAFPGRAAAPLTGKAGPWMSAIRGETPDFEALSLTFDALWLTARGRDEAAFAHSALTMWEADVVLVLRDGVVLR